MISLNYEIPNQKTYNPLDEVREAVSRAMTLCSRVEALADHLVGGPPATSSDSAERGESSDSVFYELAGRAARLNDRLASAEDALGRLEAVTRATKGACNG